MTRYGKRYIVFNEHAEHYRVRQAVFEDDTIVSFYAGHTGVSA